MLKEFVTQTKGNDIAEDSSEQQLMEVMMSRFCALLSEFEYFINHKLSSLTFHKLMQTMFSFRLVIVMALFILPTTSLLFLEKCLQIPSWKLSYIICLLICRYETELVHPVRNLLGGELARALLIQVDSCTVFSVL